MDDEIKLMKAKIEDTFAKHGISFIKQEDKDILPIPNTTAKIIFHFQKEGHNVYPMIEPIHIVTRDDANYVNYISRIIDKTIEKEG